MKYRSWKATLKTEKDFLKALNKLCDMFNKIAEASGSDKEKYIRLMNEFQNSHEFEKFITSAVYKMITPVSVANMATWRRAAKKSTRGRLIYSLLREELSSTRKLDLAIQAQLTENISLIRTLPNDVAEKVVKDISEEALKGARATTIEQIIRDKTDQHARASARLIARTETSKTTTALTKARCEMLEINWYVWRTALDGDRVRESHRNLEGVLISWNNPPSPESLVGEKDVGKYHAGNIYNCRCYPEPLIEIDDVKWPHKVYYNGTIQTMSKKQFEEIL